MISAFLIGVYLRSRRLFYGETEEGDMVPGILNTNRESRGITVSKGFFDVYSQRVASAIRATPKRNAAKW